MQRTGRKLRKTLKALTDPQPEFVSLVFGGANKSPFRAIRADGTVTEGDDMNTEVTIKADTHEIAKVEFLADKFADEPAVKAWLAEGGYDDELTVTKTEDGYVVSDPSIDADTELTMIDMTDTAGVKVYAVKSEAPLELTEEVTNEVAAKADEEVNPGANEEADPGILAMRSCYDSCYEPLSGCIDCYGVGDSVSEVVGNNFQGVPPGMLDLTMALYDAIRNNLKADNFDGARACITEYATLLDKLIALFPDDDADDEGADMAMKDDMSMGDVANAMQNPAMGFKGKGKRKPLDSVVHPKEGHNTGEITADDGTPGDIANPKGAHGKGKISPSADIPDKDGTAVHGDRNVDDKIKPNAPVKPGTKVNGQQNEGGNITPSGNLSSVASPNSAHGKGMKMKAELLAALAPEIEVAKEETADAEEVTAEKKAPAKPKGPDGGNDNVDNIGGKDMTTDQGDRPDAASADNEDTSDGGADENTEDANGKKKKTDPENGSDGDGADDEGSGDDDSSKKEDEVSGEAVEAAKSDDTPLGQLAALVGELVTSVKAMQESNSQNLEEVVQRVAAMEDVRQTRKGADVDEASTASVESPASENSRKMAAFRTDSILGRRRLLSD